jgi:SAM-dependent methyltransferase
MERMRGLKRLLRPALVALGLRPPAPPNPEAPVALTEEALGQALLRFDSGLGLFRLAHLLDALRRSPGVHSVLSVGSGLGLQEAYIAVTRPDLAVVGVDLRAARVDGTLSNLRFVQGNFFDPAIRATLPVSDFVCSVECLEHIDDDEAVVSMMVSRLKPGGHLYLQVPFASKAELADPELRREGLRELEHVRVGYSAEGLSALARRHGLTVELIAAAYRFPLQPFVAAGVEKIPLDFLLPRWRQVHALIETDVHDGLASNRSEATAIRVLARRP